MAVNSPTSPAVGFPHYQQDGPGFFPATSLLLGFLPLLSDWVRILPPFRGSVCKTVIGVASRSWYTWWLLRVFCRYGTLPFSQFRPPPYVGWKTAFRPEVTTWWKMVLRPEDTGFGQSSRVWHEGNASAALDISR
jgi:hypothetical protein